MEAEMYNHAFWLTETEPKALQHTLSDWLNRSGLRVINFVEHHFSPQGYTALWLLAESHLALHTFPEKGKSYVELSACNKGKFNQFLSLAGQRVSVSVTPPSNNYA